MSALMRYPLSGMHLIEASAGTGKTYAISALFVRLLLEKKLTVRQILVVTYTRAATEDLRLRVRQMVGGCLQAFASGRGRDDFETGLLAEIADHDQAGRRLVSALQDFDEAAIFTIHAFCQRMLKENSLESGALMDTELAPDLDELLQEIAADFWRLQMDRFPPPLLPPWRPKKFCRTDFSFLSKMRPGLQLLPAIDSAVLERIAGGGLDETEKEVSRALAAVCRVWPLVREEVHRLLLENTGLNKKSYSPEKIPLWLAEMDAFCREQPVYQGVIPENFGKFSADSLELATKKNSLAPVHPFFHLCREVCVYHEKWEALCDQGLIALRQEAARYAMDCPNLTGASGKKICSPTTICCTNCGRPCRDGTGTG